MSLGQEDEFFGDEEYTYADHHDDILHSGLHRAEETAEQQRYRILGYHEAYDQTKEDRLQDGFEAGYRDTYDVSCSIGELVGKVVIESKLAELRRDPSSQK